MIFVALLLQWIGTFILVGLSLTALVHMWGISGRVRKQFKSIVPKEKLSPSENLIRWDAYQRGGIPLQGDSFNRGYKKLTTDIANSISGKGFKNYDEFLTWWLTLDMGTRGLFCEAWESYIGKRRKELEAANRIDYTKIRLREEISNDSLVGNE